MTVKTRMKDLLAEIEELQGHPKIELVRQLCSGPTPPRAEARSKRDESALHTVVQDRMNPPRL